MRSTQPSCKDIRSKIHNAQLTAGAIGVFAWLAVLLIFVIVLIKYFPEIDNVGIPTGILAGLLLLIGPFVTNSIIKAKMTKQYPEESATIKEALSSKASFTPQTFIASGLILISVLFWIIL